MSELMQNIEADNKLSENILVAVGVITNAKHQIIIARRSDKVHQGGLWEFPGGKVETGESVQQALSRELEEELGIQVEKSEPLIKIGHQYSDCEVVLDVWRVTAFSGQVRGREGQAIRWVNDSQLGAFDFPAANAPIIKAARLPPYYAILEGSHEDEVLSNLSMILRQNIKLLQVRLKGLSTPSKKLLNTIIDRCEQHQVVTLMNSQLNYVNFQRQTGLHLSSCDLWQTKNRPQGYSWVAASCHNQQELKQAEKIAADFVVLAPVQQTACHPDVLPLGWPKFTELVLTSRLPVYALGGLQRSDFEAAIFAGAQGIAGISTFSNALSSD